MATKTKSVKPTAEQTTAIVPAKVREQLLAVINESVNIEAMNLNAQKLVTGMDKLIISSDDADAAAADLGIAASRTLEEIESVRKRLLSPAKAYTDSVNDAFAFSKMLSMAISSLRARIGAYRTKKALEEKRRQQQQLAELEKARREVIRKQEEEAKKKNAPAPPPPPPPVVVPSVAPQANTISGKIGSSEGRTVWKFRIVDAASIPESFKMVNEKAIGAAVRSGVRTIPGVEIYSEQSVAFMDK